MGAVAGTDFLNSDFPMYAAGAVVVAILYRAYVVSLISGYNPLLPMGFVVVAVESASCSPCKGSPSSRCCGYDPPRSFDMKKAWDL